VHFKRKIPSFIFGLSIGLVVGLSFFVFKINEVFDKLKDSAKGQITVIQQPVKNVPETNPKRQINKSRFKLKLKPASNPNYREADSLISNDPDLKIAREELQTVRNVKLIRLGERQPADTLAATLAGVDVENTDLYFVEFWRTPLNSKGYRFTKNKIMLYGFVDYNNILLYELDGSYYVKASGVVYRVFYGSDFKALERVVDTELLAKIN
jgi:hypothetical protein